MLLTFPLSIWAFRSATDRGFAISALGVSAVEALLLLAILVLTLFP